MLFLGNIWLCFCSDFIIFCPCWEYSRICYIILKTFGCVTIGTFLLPAIVWIVLIEGVCLFSQLYWVSCNLCHYLDNIWIWHYRDYGYFNRHCWEYLGICAIVLTTYWYAIIGIFLLSSLKEMCCCLGNKWICHYGL